MTSSPLPEVWLRGPLSGVPPLLQPVAHALLQAREEIHTLMKDFPEALLWQRPAAVASVGFHLQHLTGVLDRIFTYADGKALSLEQMRALSVEGVAEDSIKITDLVNAFHQQVDKALQQLAQTDESTLADFRGVGRAQLPSTVTGLLTHAAEHTMRHTGQLLVTVRILENKQS